MSSASLLPNWISDRVIDNSGTGDRNMRRLFDRQQGLRRTTGQPPEIRSLAMIGKRTNFISHDFRHHLSAIYAGAEFMSDPGTAQTDRQELLEEMRTTIHCMTEQLDSLLLFAQTGSPLRLRVESLNFLIERATIMVRSHPDARGVAIVFEEPETIEGWIDCRRLTSAIYNLLLNACQAAAKGIESRTVKMSLCQTPESVRIRFIDSGPGVPDAVRGILFQPFVSAERSNGFGLGLTIARQTAQEHGGKVYLEESRPGRTVFVLDLSKHVQAALASEDRANNPN
jgi:signal transduction histidine kinase